MAVWRAVSVAFSFALVATGASGASGHKPQSEPDLICYERASFWRRATDQGADDYCRLLDRARARLYSAPKEARTLSDEAQKLRPPGVAAKLLHAHAELLLGQPEAAHRQFTLAVSDLASERTAHYLTPTTVAAGARAALLTGEYALALARYRWVLLRLGEFRNASEEARLLIEAATAVAYAEQDSGREARAYLSAAEAKNAPLLRPIVKAVRSLSLLRGGDAERAKREVVEFESSWALSWMFEGQTPIGKPGEAIPVLPSGERFALFAAVAESVEPEAAEEHWTQFLDEAGPHLPQHLTRIPGR